MLFIERERARHINAALLIGGEPTLVPERVMAFVEGMDYVTISTNGLRPLPRAGFERVSIGITLFGGGGLDDELRAITPSGRTFTGLFDTALRNYRDDPRVIFNYAITGTGLQHSETTVRQIRDNGNRVTFNVYSEYHTDTPLQHSQDQRLLDEVLCVAAAYPDAVVAHSYYLRALVTGGTEFGRFGYDVCPSISWDHPGPRRSPSQQQSHATVVQRLRGRSPDHPVLLYVRALQGLPGPPGCPELAPSELATVSSLGGRAADLG